MPTGDQFVQHRSEGIDVAGYRGWLPAEQFRCHVGQGSPEIAFRRVLGQAEIHQQDAPAFFAHHVAGLDVAVEESGGMHRPERAAQLHPDQRCLAGPENSVRAEDGRQSLAMHEVGPKTDASVVYIDAVHGDHVGMPNLGGQAGFAQHGIIVGRVRAAVVPQQFECDFPLQLRIPSEVYLAETALANPFPQLEGSPIGQERRFVADPAGGVPIVRKGLGCILHSLPARPER